MITRLQRVLYKIRRRLFVADFSLWMICPIERLCKLKPKDQFQASRLENADRQIELLSECNPNLDCDAFRSLNAERFRCFAIKSDDRVIAYAWTGIGEIPSEHNCNGHPWTGLSIKLTSEDVYLFSAYVRPEYRGRRLYEALIGHIARTFFDDGLRRILLTTDACNTSALNAVQRMGFLNCGTTQFVGWGTFRRSKYEMTTAFLPNVIGFYCGDTHPRVNE